MDKMRSGENTRPNAKVITDWRLISTTWSRISSRECRWSHAYLESSKCKSGNPPRKKKVDDNKAGTADQLRDRIGSLTVQSTDVRASDDESSRSR